MTKKTQVERLAVIETKLCAIHGDILDFKNLMEKENKAFKIDMKELTKRTRTLEDWRWYLAGGIAVIAFLLVM